MVTTSGRPASAPARRTRPDADSTISMRIPAHTRELIDTAAATLGKSRTEFILDSARLRAMNVLLDRRLFNLDKEASTAFARALAEPVPSNEALRTLMKTPERWG